MKMIALIGLLALTASAQPNVYVWKSGVIPSQLTNNIPQDLTNAVQISGGFNHIAALRSDGTISCWGVNTYGQTDTPVDITTAVQVVAGSNYTAALLADGTVRGWGTMQNGNGIESVLSNVTDGVEIAINVTNVIVLHVDGTISAFPFDSSSTGLMGLTNIDAVASTYMNSWITRKCDGCVTNGGNMGQLAYDDAGDCDAITCTSSYAAVLRCNGTVCYWNPSTGSCTNSAVTNIVALSVGSPTAILGLDAAGKVKKIVGTFATPASSAPLLKAISTGYGFGVGIVQ